jgi:flagellar motor switch protein FliM
VRLRGPKLPLNDLLRLEPGDIIPLDFPLSRRLDFLVNGTLKFRGQVVSAGNKKAFLVEESRAGAG